MDNLSRRSFLKGVGGVSLGMGMMPIMGLLGLETQAKAEAAAEQGLKYFANLNESDELLEAVKAESEVTSDLTMSNGTVIPAVYVRLRNRINRIGQGIGSIPRANSYEMIMNLWSPEDAENYLKMPLHQMFTAGNYAAEAGITEEEAPKTWNDLLDPKWKDQLIMTDPAQSSTSKYWMAAMMQNENLRIALSFTDEWNSLQGENGSTLVTGVTIVRNEAVEKNPQAFAEFLKEYEASIAYLSEDLASAAEMIVAAGIFAQAPVAQKAIPNCNLCFVNGAEMKTKLSGYLTVLFEADKTSVGGKLPADDFYYAG